MTISSYAHACVATKKILTLYGASSSCLVSQLPDRPQHHRSRHARPTRPHLPLSAPPKPHCHGLTVIRPPTLPSRSLPFPSRTRPLSSLPPSLAVGRTPGLTVTPRAPYDFAKHDTQLRSLQALVCHLSRINHTTKAHVQLHHHPPCMKFFSDRVSGNTCMYCIGARMTE
jgi:hypothetical protein